MPYGNQYQTYPYPWQGVTPPPAWQPVQPSQAAQQTWLPQQQTAQQPQRLVGRTVASAQEVTPQEVPMDGSLALFPLADGSAVIGKRWTPEGTIAEVRFVPERHEEAPAAPTFESSVLDRLDAIEGSLASLMTTAQQPKRQARRAKEAGDES
ncbi:hypothetical protein [Thermophilibacter sp.]